MIRRTFLGRLAAWVGIGAWRNAAKEWVQAKGLQWMVRNRRFLAVDYREVDIIRLDDVAIIRGDRVVLRSGICKNVTEKAKRVLLAWAAWRRWFKIDRDRLRIDLIESVDCLEPNFIVRFEGGANADYMGDVKYRLFELRST